MTKWMVTLPEEAWEDEVGSVAELWKEMIHRDSRHGSLNSLSKPEIKSCSTGVKQEIERILKRFWSRLQT